MHFQLQARTSIVRKWTHWAGVCAYISDNLAQNKRSHIIILLSAKHNRRALSRGEHPFTFSFTISVLTTTSIVMRVHILTITRSTQYKQIASLKLWHWHQKQSLGICVISTRKLCCSDKNTRGNESCGYRTNKQSLHIHGINYTIIIKTVYWKGRTEMDVSLARAGCGINYQLSLWFGN